MKVDLEVAGIIYRDSGGLVADFQSLRHTFITNLYRAGVSTKLIRFLARHSRITLTMERSTHVDMGDQAAALVGLPYLPGITPGEGRPAEEVVQNGDNIPSISCTDSCAELVQTDGVACQGQSPVGSEDDHPGPEENRP